MALLFIDGFDAGDAALKWGQSGTFAQATRFGTGLACKFASTAGAQAFPAASRIFFGAAVAVTNMGAQRNIWIFQGDSGVTSHLTLSVATTGALVLVRPGGTTVSAAGVVTISTWVYLEMSATISDTVGEVEVRANGVTVLTFSGDTKNGGTAETIDRVNIPLSTSGSLDDVYICDSTGSANNTFLGDVRVQTLVPTGAGASTQFTPSAGANWQTVDELPYSVTDYNSDSISGHRDSFVMSDLISGTTGVMGVQTNLVAAKTDAGAASIKPVARSGGVVYYGPTQVLGTSAAWYGSTREQDPATSAAWTTTNVNALESGVEVA